jgi:hypothetical protein
MLGKLRKPQFEVRLTSNGEGQSPRKNDYVTGFFIEPDGEPNKRVFAAREDLQFPVIDTFPFGSQRFVENPPRVEFDVIDERAVNVRMIA